MSIQQSGTTASSGHAPSAPARPGASVQAGATHAKAGADKGQSPFLALLAALGSDASPMGEVIAAIAADETGAADGDKPVDANPALSCVALPLVSEPAHANAMPAQDIVTTAPVRQAPAAHEAGCAIPEACAGGTDGGQIQAAAADATDMVDPLSPRRFDLSAAHALSAVIARSDINAEGVDLALERGSPRHPDPSVAQALGTVTARGDSKAAGARLALERGAAQAASVPVASASPLNAANASASIGAWADGMLVASKAMDGARTADRAAQYGATLGVVLPGALAHDAPTQGGALTPTPVFSIDGTGAAASAALADKLSYWVSRGVQNAELSLDAFGGGMVDVSIAVQGQDAQVEFRSDAPEARQVLRDAMPQLEKLLGGEGLRLAGSFVGSSADNGTGAERRKSPAGARAARLRVEDGAAPVPAHARGVWSEGRTGGNVDLFV